MNGRVAKVVAMFNALEDADKVEVLEAVVYPHPPAAETAAEAEQAEDVSPVAYEPDWADQ